MFQVNAKCRQCVLFPQVQVRIVEQPRLGSGAFLRSMFRSATLAGWKMPDPHAVRLYSLVLCVLLAFLTVVADVPVGAGALCAAPTILSVLTQACRSTDFQLVCMISVTTAVCNPLRVCKHNSGWSCRGAVPDTLGAQGHAESHCIWRLGLPRHPKRGPQQPVPA